MHMCKLSMRVCLCVEEKRPTVCPTQPMFGVDYVSRNLAAAQHGTITMEGDNLIVLNGGFRVNAPPAGSCQVVISHYGRWRTQRNPTTTPVRTGGTPEGKGTDDFPSLALALSHTHKHMLVFSRPPDHLFRVFCFWLHLKMFVLIKTLRYHWQLIKKIFYFLICN